MKRFEYDISRHPADEFSRVVYFCTDQGECGLDRVLTDQIAALNNVLDARGAEGWELVQLLVAREGVLGFWKREA
jgi:hypothetical protein